MTTEPIDSGPQQPEAESPVPYAARIRDRWPRGDDDMPARRAARAAGGAYRDVFFGPGEPGAGGRNGVSGSTSGLELVEPGAAQVPPQRQGGQVNQGSHEFQGKGTGAASGSAGVDERCGSAGRA